MAHRLLPPATRTVTVTGTARLADTDGPQILDNGTDADQTPQSGIAAGGGAADGGLSRLASPGAFRTIRRFDAAELTTRHHESCHLEACLLEACLQGRLEATRASEVASR